jgi:hypothetical protein
MRNRDNRIFRIWCGMKNRCHGKVNPLRDGSVYYAMRGIRVCDEWRFDFKAFELWAMENGYRDDLQIDRIDSDGNYEPSNCRWVTPSEQSRNIRRNTPEFLSALAKNRRWKSVPVMRLDTGEVFPTQMSASLKVFGNAEMAYTLHRALNMGYRFGGVRWCVAMPEWLLNLKPCSGWEQYQ